MTRPDFADRIFANVSIGAGGSDPAKRFVNQADLEKGGWSYFFRPGGGIDRYADWGCPNFFFMNPAGVTANPDGTIGWYEFGQMIRARDGVKGRNPKLSWLSGFDVAWAAFAKARAKKGQIVRAVPYVGAGTPGTDPELDPAKTTHVQRLDYFNDSLRRLLACRAIGFDSLTQVPMDSGQGLRIRALAAEGIEVFGEGFPTKDNPGTAEFSVLCTDDNFNRRLDGPTPGGWGVPIESIKGRIVVIRDPQSEAKGESVEAFARRNLASGRCVALPIYDLISRGVPLTALDPAKN